MIQYDKGIASRLGNRSINQDRGCIIEHNESLLIVVADGMGGHRGGEEAAQQAVNTFREILITQKTPIPNPLVFLDMTMREAHKQIGQLGQQDNEPYYPRTTCVACLIQENTAYWAHLGDSRLYFLRAGQLLDRTRDHTYIEELFQNQVISEAEMLTHPLRNYVTYCLGGPNEMPPVSTGQQDDLQVDDMILLCSDGLWGAINVEDITRLSGIALDTAINRMAEEAERSSYPNSDNVTLLGITITAVEAQAGSRQSTPAGEKVQ